MWSLTLHVLLLQVLIITRVNAEISRFYSKRNAVFHLEEEDSRVYVGIISSKEVASLFLCINHCVATFNCNSINFKVTAGTSGLHECELVDKESTEVTESQTGWNYYKPAPQVSC